MSARVTFALYGRLARLHARMLLAIMAGIYAFEVFMVWISAQMDTGPGLATLIEQFLPPEMQRMVFDQFGVADFRGAVAFGFQHPIFLVAVVAFIVVAGSVPAAERETGFLDLVLARPVRRHEYLAAVTMMVATGAVVLPVAILAGAATGLATVDAAPVDVAWTAYLPASADLTLMLLALGGVCLLAAAGAPRRAQAVGRAVGLILVFYWLDFVAPFWDPVETARWVSPFSYFDPAGAVRSGLGARDVAVLLGVFVATTVAGFVRFSRQDV